MASVQVHIEKLVYGGEGLAHANGQTIFVPFVLAGESAEIEVTERKKKLMRGRVVRLLKPSPERMAPRCPHFGTCGGCHYQHLSYDRQLHLKEAILRETLKRIGRIDWAGAITVHKSPPWEYRNRAQWKVRPLAADGSQNRAHSNSSAIGYFRARSSALCPVEVCSLISPKLLETFTILREALAGGSLPATFEEIEAFASGDDRQLLLNITGASTARSREALLQKFAELIPAAKSILIQDIASSQMALKGPGFIQYRVLERWFRVAHLSFFQVNRFLLEEMATTVARLAGAGESLFDLYAGAGLFSLALAGNFSRLLAVEADPVSARDLEMNAGASAKSIAIHNQPANAFLNQWKRRPGAPHPDAVVADPPRAGLEEGVAEQLAGLAPRRIVYVSCDPATLARDLAKLCARKYTLREIHLFDMFPQTYHIESAILLERAPP